MIYKIACMLLLVPFFSGCNDTDDVAAIFTGKVWKLNYISVDNGHEMFNFWGNDAEARKNSIKELEKKGSYNIVFEGSVEGDIMKGKIKGTLINDGSLSGTWSANGKTNDFHATVTGSAGNDFLAKAFMEGLSNATSYDGDNKNLYLLYKPKSSEKTFRMFFRVAE